MMYDLAIIGGGPAGYSAAFEAVRLKLSVVLFENDLLGGTCLNRGCIPTKFLVHAARVYTDAADAERYGITFTDARIDYAKMSCRKSEIISDLREGLYQQMVRQKIEIVTGEALICDKSHVTCNGITYGAKNILIAAGSLPADPLVTGAVSSDDLLELKEIPKKLHILGGGTIAVEFANIFHALGSEVEISIRGDRILRKWDKEIAVGLTQSMKKKGIRVQKKCDFKNLQIEEDALVLSAGGRVPNVKGLPSGLFEKGSDGGIKTDIYGRTNVEGVFAAGDVVTESPQLAHTGMEQGRRAVQYIAGIPVSEPSAVVKCIYVDQEIASIGLTEAEAVGQNRSILTAKQNMYSNARTMISTTERGLIKILADRESQKIAGAQLMCERAGEIAAELALAINNGLTVKDMLDSTRPHPSYCEAVTDALMTLQEKLK